MRSPGVLRGHVVDFVSVGWWPVFNVADSCLVAGVIAQRRTSTSPAGDSYSDSGADSASACPRRRLRFPIRRCG